VAPIAEGKKRELEAARHAGLTIHRGFGGLQGIFSGCGKTHIVARKEDPGVKAPHLQGFVVGLKPYANPKKQQQRLSAISPRCSPWIVPVDRYS
jgi:hypothetical protein